MDHGKLSKTHKRNPAFSELSVCGIGGPGMEDRLKLTNAWSRVDCGNCIAHADAVTEPIVPAPVGPQARELYQDSHRGSPTVWEKEYISEKLSRMWPLSLSGSRLPMPAHSCPTFRQLEVRYGPLIPVSELDIAHRHVRALESRLAQGNL